MVCAKILKLRHKGLELQNFSRRVERPSFLRIWSSYVLLSFIFKRKLKHASSTLDQPARDSTLACSSPCLSFSKPVLRTAGCPTYAGIDQALLCRHGFGVHLVTYGATSTSRVITTCVFQLRACHWVVWMLSYFALNEPHCSVEARPSQQLHARALQ